MGEKVYKRIDKEILEKNIEELRDILNKVCIKDESIDNMKNRLVISERLDKLIVEYMNT